MNTTAFRAPKNRELKNDPIDSKIRTLNEDELVFFARDAISDSDWIVGACALNWTERYSRGRGDGCFGELIGMSEDQIFQRRRTYARFSNSRFTFPFLTWSHFNIASPWDDAAAWLWWANTHRVNVKTLRETHRECVAAGAGAPIEAPAAVVQQTEIDATETYRKPSRSQVTSRQLVGRMRRSLQKVSVWLEEIRLEDLDAIQASRIRELAEQIISKLSSSLSIKD